MERSSTYTHGLNHELGNIISMIRIAVACGRKLLLWTDEGCVTMYNDVITCVNSRFKFSVHGL